MLKTIVFELTTNSQNFVVFIYHGAICSAVDAISIFSAVFGSNSFVGPKSCAGCNFSRYLSIRAPKLSTIFEVVCFSQGFRCENINKTHKKVEKNKVVC